MRRSKENPDALTDDEIAFLRSDKAPDAVRQFVSRRHESLGTRTRAYRKVAAAARAERDALVEIATLGAIRAAAGNTVAAEQRVKQLEAEQRQLTRELNATRSQLEQATAAPAIAVHSGGRE
jgi:hypothetical protein